MNHPSLKEAVVEAVTNLRASNVPFSIFDITRNIREQANLGRITISGLQREIFVDGNGKSVDSYNITHSDVRGHFDALVARSAFPNLQRSFNGQYNVFQFDSSTGRMSTSTVTPAPTAPVFDQAASDKIILTELDTAFTATRKTKTIGLIYKGKSFITPEGRALWRRRSNASAAFCSTFFGTYMTLSRRLTASGSNESPAKFKARMLAAMKASGDLAFIELQ